MCKKNKPDCSQIELKADNTFDYLIHNDPDGSGNLTSGTWKQLTNDTIELNTILQPEIPVTIYNGKINPELKNKIRIYFSDKDGPLEHAIVRINDSNEEKETNYEGMVEFEAEQVNIIKYSFIMNEEEIQIKNPNHNEINIQTKDQDILHPEYLKNYKLNVN
ncbi:hypothetical protein [Winogradskyella aquimaris]|uniref:Uncharacterized protein n=1 Tax=Winogradskyella aquimaris TaxID=864074 RepID=A0ABU5ES54_9FLAO|nr:hypothetical protein [Winogradskyella aquimaris]MDY2587701.1 hypothetical protein [Winogradskyella aquimaris]